MVRQISSRACRSGHSSTLSPFFERFIPLNSRSRLPRSTSRHEGKREPSLTLCASGPPPLPRSGFARGRPCAPWTGRTFADDPRVSDIAQSFSIHPPPNFMRVLCRNSARFAQFHSADCGMRIKVKIRGGMHAPRRFCLHAANTASSCPRFRAIGGTAKLGAPMVQEAHAAG
jgi:hypothetical protein